MSGTTYAERRDALLTNPCTSYALQHALRAFDARDVVDAAVDAYQLHELCELRLYETRRAELVAQAREVSRG